jgi:hypothetical protein
MWHQSQGHPPITEAKVRPWILENVGFQRQLVELEALEESYRPGYGGLGWIWGRMSHKKCVGPNDQSFKSSHFSGTDLLELCPKLIILAALKF